MTVIDTTRCEQAAAYDTVTHEFVFGEEQLSKPKELTGTYKVKMSIPLSHTWLGFNTRNRPDSKSEEGLIVGAIERYEWFYNGETIKFDWNGVVIDGQTRLGAFAKATWPKNIQIFTDVTFGLDPKAFDTIDLTRRRAPHHVLAMRGEKYSSDIQSSLSLLDRYLNDRVTSNSRYTPDQILKLMEKHKGITDSVAMSYQNRTVIGCVPRSVVACVHFIGMTISPDDTNKFFGLISDENLIDITHPIFAWRRLLVRSKLTKRRIDQAEHLALLIKTWNAFRQNKKVITLGWRHSGSQPEPFPRMI